MEQFLEKVSKKCGQEPNTLLNYDWLDDELKNLVEDMPRGIIGLDTTFGFGAHGQAYKIYEITNGKIKYRLKIKLLKDRYGGGNFIGVKSANIWFTKYLYSYAYIVISGRVI